ncbi:hypothetical protein GGR51DRAFT_517226 [Nemania sp. FL0031]|nr:hypothetical protein GGR51DRAFT_517226 [Nemania sp. FL0031]
MESSSNTEAAAIAARELLATVLPGRITRQTDDGYQAEKDHPWSTNCWLPAACFVRPANTHEVAEVLQVVKKTGTKFAIRSGGHNFNPGFSSVEGYGIVIDLQDLNSLEFLDDGTLRAGAGNTWGAVFSFLDERGLSAIGGRQNNVGISGYLLGGGMPAFPNLHGLAADNVKNYEVVLADATIVNANADQNADLYRSLKGGGSNFGVVTRFDIATYKIGTQSTLAMYSIDGFKEVLRATKEAQQAMEKDPKIGMFTSVSPEHIAVGLFYADSEAENPPVFETFLNLKSLVQVYVRAKKGTIKTLVDVIGPLQPPTRRIVGTVTTKVSYDFYLAVHEMWLKTVKEHPELSSLQYNIQPASSTTAQIGEDNGGNILGLEKVAQTWWSLVAEWGDPVNDVRGSQAIDALEAGITRLAKEHAQSLGFLFMNDAKFSQNVLGSYGKGNVEKLKSTAAKHDPEGLFQSYQNDGFLLRKLEL